MTLNKEQRKKAADIFEKLGVTVLIATIGDMIVTKSIMENLFWDIIGLSSGLILMIIAILILREVADD